MNNEILPILEGILLDEENTVTLAELCRACSVHAEWVAELVDEGVLEPLGVEYGQWRFPAVSMQRAMTVRHLQQDLGVNLAGAALVVELIEEIDTLRTRLQAIEPNLRD